MNNQALLRYSRQILLPEWGIEGQQKIAKANVLIMGVGGLGSASALYLATAGVGRLRLIDFDQVELSNLQRQILHQQSSIGQSKVESAKAQLIARNSDCQISTIADKLDETALEPHIEWADIVLDGTDNFNSRFMINRLCVKNQTPLVSAAAIRWEAQVSIFNSDPIMPCYQCLYADNGEQDENCVNNGVIAPLVGIIGSIQALETLKYLARVGQTLAGKLLVFDGLNMQWRTINLKKDSACLICNG